MAADVLQLNSQKNSPMDIGVYKVIPCVYTGPDETSIEKYKASQTGSLFRHAKVTLKHDGAVCLLNQPVHFFSLNKDLTSIYPLRGTSGNTYARAHGFIPWSEECKLWQVIGAELPTQRPVVLTFGSRDEAKILNRSAFFTELPFDKHNKLLYYNGYSWSFSASNPHINLCVLRDVSTSGLNWDGVEKRVGSSPSGVYASLLSRLRFLNLEDL